MISLSVANNQLLFLYVLYHCNVLQEDCIYLAKQFDPVCCADDQRYAIVNLVKVEIFYASSGENLI